MVLEPGSPSGRGFTDWVYEALGHILVVYLLALYVTGRTSHLSVLFVCCLFLIRAPIPAYEDSYREGESQVHFGVRT